MRQGSWRRVGIVGGVGPLAGAQFYLDLVEETPAASDGEHLPVVLVCEPEIPSRREYLFGRGPSPGPALRDVVQVLAGCGSEIIAVPSSTCHAFFEEFSAVEGVMCINLVEEVAAVASAFGWRRVGILGTEASCRARVYDEAVARAGMEPIYPEPAAQQGLDAIIEHVKTGQELQGAADRLAQALEEMWPSRCDGVILACTELALLERRMLCEAPVASASRILAGAVLREARVQGGSG